MPSSCSWFTAEREMVPRFPLEFVIRSQILASGFYVGKAKEMLNGHNISIWRLPS
jgi:hypothetical protein